MLSEEEILMVAEVKGEFTPSVEVGEIGETFRAQMSASFIVMSN